MFFPRLRRQAKWMFVLLALVFGGGFVIFGVGSNLPSGLGDVLRDVEHTNTPSVDDARDRVRRGRSARRMRGAPRRPAGGMVPSASSSEAKARAAVRLPVPAGPWRR
jgi:hypothetical protein